MRPIPQTDSRQRRLRSCSEQKSREGSGEGTAHRCPEIDAYWKTLDDGQRQTIEAAAFRSAKPLVVAGYERAAANGEGHLQEIYRRTILDQYLIEHLVDPEAATAELTN